MKPILRLLFAAFVLETLCVTYALYLTWLVPLASILYTVSGIAIAYGLLFMKPATVEAARAAGSKKRTALHWTIIAAAFFLMCFFATRWMKEEPLNHETADMLPIIQVMCRRFLAGGWSHVYDPINEIWSGTVPIYLPAMWLPFSLPELLGVDLRWITVVVFLVILILFALRTDIRQQPTWPLWGSCFLLLWWLFGVDKAGLLPYTEEAVVVFYYVLLTLALLRSKQNFWLIGICASLCVLSRYALAGWLPAMALYFVYRRAWKDLLRFAVTGIACFLLLVLLPFGFEMIHSIFGLPGSYIAFAGRVWNDSPDVFSTSLGWAKFFGPGRIAQQHLMLIIFTFCIPFAAMWAALFLQRKYNFPSQHLPLAVLKLSLVMFFSLIDVPYLYLFYTSSFVSLFAVAAFVGREKQLIAGS